MKRWNGQSHRQKLSAWMEISDLAMALFSRGSASRAQRYLKERHREKLLAYKRVFRRMKRAEI